MIYNYSVAELSDLQNKVVEDNNIENLHIVKCVETDELYIWETGRKCWSKLMNSDTGLKMSLYDLNKAMIKTLEFLTPDQLEKKKELIKDYFKRNPSKHHMLLCKEYNYYTIFEKDTFFLDTINLPFEETVLDIITDLGEIYDIDNDTNGDNLQIWIRLKEEENPFVFYLFSYDRGVVYYG